MLQLRAEMLVGSSGIAVVLLKTICPLRNVVNLMRKNPVPLGAPSYRRHILLGIGFVIVHEVLAIRTCHRLLQFSLQARHQA